VAAFVWNRWQASPGFDGSFALESVAGITGIRTRSRLPQRYAQPQEAPFESDPGFIFPQSAQYRLTRVNADGLNPLLL